MSSQKPHPPFDVIPDTNALFTENVSQLISPAFETEWRATKELWPLKLLIPEIVREERLFRVSYSAKEALRQAARNCQNISQLVGRQLPQLPTETEVDVQIRDMFGKLSKDMDAEILPIPFDSIDWREVVRCACWRVSPFVFEKTSKTEKGFRDKILLETVVLHAKAGNSIVFLCNDTELRKATAEQLPHGEHLLYEDFPAFASYIRLRDEEVTKARANALIEIVRNRVLASTFLDELKIPDAVRDFLDQRSSPHSSSLAGQLVSADQRLFVGSTVFDHKDSAGDLVWKTEITHVELFSLSQSPAFLIISEFSLKWSADTGADEKLSNLKSLGLELRGSRSEAPTPDLCLHYALPVPSQAAPNPFLFPLPEPIARPDIEEMLKALRRNQLIKRMFGEVKNPFSLESPDK